MDDHERRHNMDRPLDLVREMEENAKIDARIEYDEIDAEEKREEEGLEGYDV